MLILVYLKYYHKRLYDFDPTSIIKDTMPFLLSEEYRLHGEMIYLEYGYVFITVEYKKESDSELENELKRLFLENDWKKHDGGFAKKRVSLWYVELNSVDSQKVLISHLPESHKNYEGYKKELRKTVSNIEQ